MARFTGDCEKLHPCCRGLARALGSRFREFNVDRIEQRALQRRPMGRELQQRIGERCKFGPSRRPAKHVGESCRRCAGSIDHAQCTTRHGHLPQVKPVSRAANPGADHHETDFRPTQPGYGRRSKGLQRILQQCNGRSRQ